MLRRELPAMRAHKLKTTIPEDHRLNLEVPGDLPAGPAEIIILAPAPEERKIVRLGGVLGGGEDWLREQGNPIAEVLDEVREERQALLDRKQKDLVRGNSD